MVERRGKAPRGYFEVIPLVPGEDKPAPPDDMSELEQRVWVSVVNAMPLRYFGRETWPNLRSLCRHTVAADCLWELYRGALEAKKKPDVIEQYATLHNRESAAVRRLSADLRLAKSARHHSAVTDRAKKNQVIKRPWDD
jgi:hypothetical protein